MIRMSEGLPRTVSKVIEAVRSLVFEGVIAIRRDSLYQTTTASIAQSGPARPLFSRGRGISSLALAGRSLPNTPISVNE